MSKLFILPDIWLLMLMKIRRKDAIKNIEKAKDERFTEIAEEFKARQDALKD